jgi:hypothetical protein
MVCLFVFSTIYQLEKDHSMNNKLSIRKLVEGALNESSEPFFQLAPDIVGSINNPVRNRKKGIIVIGLNLVDGKSMKLVVPEKCYDSSKESGDNAKTFVNKFLTGAEPVDSLEGVDDLNEIVDEYGNLFNDNEDLPVNTRSSAGYYNHKSGDKAQRQFVSRYQRLISPLGYGGVVW